MSRPFGSKNKPRVVETGNTVFTRTDDAYGQAFLNSPTVRAQFGGTVGWLMDRQTIEDIYLGNGFGRLIIDRVAEEMTRAGFELENLEPEIEDTVIARIEELNAMNKLCDALKWSRAFGGSAIVLGLKDGGDFLSPLVPEKIQAVEFLRVYDRFQIDAISKYSDPAFENYGRVEFWRINPADGATPYVVHESRIFIFDGDSIPNSLRNQNQGWGASILQKCIIELRRLNNAHKWAEMLLQRSQQAVHGIPDLSSTLADPAGKSLLIQRIDIVDQVRNAQNTVVIDALETYEIKQAPMGGVPDVLDRFAEALSSVTGIPVFVLMGRSAGGLNSPGESNEKSWYSQIENMQNTMLRNPLDKLISYIILASNGGKNDGADYSLEFKPLAVPNDKDEADIELKKSQALKTKADAHNVYVNMGALDPLEVRKELAVENEYIDDSIEPIAPAEKLQEQANEFAQSQAKIIASKPAATGKPKPGGKNAKA